MRTQHRTLVICLAYFFAFAVESRGQNLTGRASTQSFSYVYGAGADSHTGSNSVNEFDVLPSDSEHLEYEGSTTGTLPNGQPYAAGSGFELDQTYAVTGSLSAFKAIEASGESWVSAGSSGAGIASTHASNPGNELFLYFTVDTTAEFHITGNLATPGVGFWSYVSLERHNGSFWERVFSTIFLQNGQGAFDVTGTMLPGSYRMASNLAVDAFGNEYQAASYDYRLEVRHRGDMNCDGLVNGNDIAAFMTALFNSVAYEAQFPECNALNGDMNGDQAVAVDDVEGFVECVLTGGC